MNEREPLPKISSTNNNKKLIDIGNKAIKLILHNTNSNITILNEILYSTALVITKQSGIKIRKRKLNKRKQPAWKEKIEREITNMRSELSIIDEVERGVNVHCGRLRKIKRKYRIKTDSDIATTSEILKQKIQLKAQRIRRYEKITKFFRQNNFFNPIRGGLLWSGPLSFIP